jgi:hypothetical protein
VIVIDAINELVVKLTDLNRRQLLTGLPILAEADMTWGERALELQARVNLIVADGPSQDVLDALGAHVLAFKIALAEAEETQVESGSEAA